MQSASLPVAPFCPLCFTEPPSVFSAVGGRIYWRCRQCRLIYLSPAHHLAPSREKARYDLHENDPSDQGYRRFLRRLTDELTAHLPPDARGLDYGAGPAPAIPDLLEEYGHTVETYDPLYASDTDRLDDRYDFLTCTEAAEHFFRPAHEFGHFDRLLRPGGWIGIMTRMVDRLERLDHGFDDWHYRRDRTHVCFYSRATMHWIGRRFAWICSCPRDDVILFHKPRLLPVGRAARG